MEQEEAPLGQPVVKHPFTLRNMVIVWVVATVCLVIAMGFTVVAQREIAQYTTASYEAYARNALEAHEYNRAVRICTGALKVGLGRGNYWGLAHLLRAEAYAGAGKYGAALADARYAARFWNRCYFYAKDGNRKELADLATGLGRDFLRSGDVDSARKAISAAGIGSGQPARYLRDEFAALEPGERKALWPDDEPSLTVEDFEGQDAPLLEKSVEQQGREILKSTRTGDGAEIQLTASQKAGVSRYQAPVYIPLSQEPFALRLTVKEATPSNVDALISYWFETAHQAEATIDSPSKNPSGDVKTFDIHRDFYRERAAYAKKQGYDPVGGIIYEIGIDVKPGPANTYLLGKIELYIPKRD